MYPGSIDPVLQTVMVGATVQALGSAVSISLFVANSRDRYLLFWAGAGLAQCLRWLLHYAAENHHLPTLVEAVPAAVGFCLLLLGAYDLLPVKPWRLGRLAAALAALFGVITLIGAEFDMLFAVFYGTLPLLTMVVVWCLWKGYRATGLSGFALAALAYALQTAFIVVAQYLWGMEVRNMVATPLFTLPVVASFLCIAIQRSYRRVGDAEHILRKIFDTAPIPLVICRAPGGEIEHFNQAMLNLTGISASELRGKSAAAIGLASDPERRAAMYAKLQAGELVVRHEVVYSCLGRQSALFAVNASKLVLDDGERYIFVLYDLTELRNAQDALQALNAGLERQVAERTRDLDAFSYSVSHDLRAPLRAVAGYAAILAEEAGHLSEAGKRSLTRIRGSCERMGELINALLHLARQTRTTLNVQQVDLSAIADNLRAELTLVAPERPVEWAIAPGMRAVADPVAARVVLDNLVGNAWKYSAKCPRARIEIGVESRSAEEVYYVRDNGAGFDPRYASRLYEPFQRLHRSQDFEGDGIGLATVRRLVERHGGRIWAEAAPGLGATFYFTLAAAPRHNSPAHADGKPSMGQPRPMAAN